MENQLELTKLDGSTEIVTVRQIPLAEILKVFPHAVVVSNSCLNQSQ